MGGRFVLRIEDTDIERSSERYEQDLYQQFRWLGLDWDEGPDKGGPHGPYRQSERGPLYLKAARRLLDEGQAYLCYCTREELEAEREAARAKGLPPRYSGRCRVPEVREALAAEGRMPVVRFRVPDDTEITFRDLIRREITFNTDDFGDFVIYRPDSQAIESGHVLYNLAAVVDDHAMEIDVVLRGEEHLSNTPLQILLYRALGYPEPQFGHLSLILTPEGTKMSKRFGDISIAHYREEGYLPEALVAYMATLGWAPGRKAERFDLEDLVERFDIRRLSSNPSEFDPERLLWFNKRRLQRADTARIAELVRPRLEAAYDRWHAAEGTLHEPESWFQILVSATQEEASTLNEMVELAAFAFQDGVETLTDEARDALADEWARPVLAHCVETVSEDALATPQRANLYFKELRHYFRDTAEIRGRRVMFPVRAALTGSVTGPCLGVVSSLLGKKRVVERLEDAQSWM
jgi:nondiscriminating glutamyl-tRNA synthetase